MALLELRDVQAAYGSIQILHGVSLQVNPGEVVAVIGPNGAGKSTTFKVIMGFITHLGGEIVFDGRSLVGQRPHRVLGLGLGYVPQGRVVFTQMTVRENLEMGAYLERDRAKVQASMDFVYSLFPRLGERPRQQAGTMSGGEQQMLAMGRALMMRPRMMMLDEPSLGLSRPRAGDRRPRLRAGAGAEPLRGRRPRPAGECGGQADVPRGRGARLRVTGPSPGGPRSGRRAWARPVTSARGGGAR
jgi:branched-chain amino acid transport system ATP-binding protein